MKDRTLLIGNGHVASGIAKALLSENMPVLLTTPDMAPAGHMDSPCPLLEVLPQTVVRQCTGAAGNFQVTLSGPAGAATFAFSSIVIAEDSLEHPLFPLYGLAPGPTVLSLSQAVKALNSPVADPILSSGKTAVFVVGLAQESHPHMVETAMLSCLRLQTETGMHTMILTRNLKVGASGLEALFRRTREAGVIIVKFSDTLPVFTPQADGKVRITFVDEITQMPFTVQADVTVVNEAIAPSPCLKDLSRIFRLDMNAAGYLQSDNVHRLSVFTNRSGILAAGGSRGVLPPAGLEAEIQHTALTVVSLAKAMLTPSGSKAEIHAGACVRCLTCFRLCPYGAITLNTRPVVIADVCERCGICAAECPAEAIHIDDLNIRAVAQTLEPPLPADTGTSFVPFLVAFCCSRSAGRARELAASSGRSLPRGLSIVEVPCAGAISLEYLLTAFRHRADGVLVFTCHEGNCHSERGNILAGQRAAHLKTMLAQIGIDPARLVLKTLAANMAAEFAETADAFEKRIASAGPTGIQL